MTALQDSMVFRTDLIEKAAALARALLEAQFPHSVSQVGLFGPLARGGVGPCKLDLILFLEEGDYFAEELAINAADHGDFLYGELGFDELLGRLSLWWLNREDMRSLHDLIGGVGVDLVIMPHPAQIDEQYVGYFQCASPTPEFLAEMAWGFQLFNPGSGKFESATAPWQRILLLLDEEDNMADEEELDWDGTLEGTELGEPDEWDTDPTADRLDEDAAALAKVPTRLAAKLLPFLALASTTQAPRFAVLKKEPSPRAAFRRKRGDPRGR